MGVTVTVNDIDVKYILQYLGRRKKILFLTTSNRYVKHNDQPKSTALAYRLATLLSAHVEVKVIEVPLLNIYPCEGNVSAKDGNNCGVKGASLPDKKKNPTGQIRCWASYNNPDDELYKIANAIFECDTVVFFSSVRWGQANGYYQKLIERLDWLENRWSALGETNILAGKKAGFICVGQNWNGAQVVITERKVLSFYGFDTPSCLFGHWQYTDDELDETLISYKRAIDKFEGYFDISMKKFLSVLSSLRRRFRI